MFFGYLSHFTNILLTFIRVTKNYFKELACLFKRLFRHVHLKVYGLEDLQWIQRTQFRKNHSGRNYFVREKESINTEMLTGVIILFQTCVLLYTNIDFTVYKQNFN